MRKGRVYRVYKRPGARGLVECQFCGVLVPWERVRFSALGGEEMCPGCKRREKEYLRKRHA